ncbi:hypothetical protein B0H17DRAFT_1049319 [Mycena rosella]|uniref:F-box domain-containing protein n=1 Tax=Mycena rosella TaxID=1033263 RepID=A0AAD7DTC7_MYCRO|nr:hypothetical protein B0H17DRAFT_1049319 [Mycena rosella]
MPMATLLQLPPEICAHVCADVERADLVTLCTISRVFRDQAQRLMYRAVDLQDCAPQDLRSWCLAVTRHPQLAERVHKLILSFPSTFPFHRTLRKWAEPLPDVSISKNSLFFQPASLPRTSQFKDGLSINALSALPHSPTPTSGALSYPNFGVPKRRYRFFPFLHPTPISRVTTTSSQT